MSEYYRDLYSASDHRENITRLEAEIAAAKKQGALEFADRAMKALNRRHMTTVDVLDIVSKLRAEIEGEK